MIESVFGGRPKPIAARRCAFIVDDDPAVHVLLTKLLAEIGLSSQSFFEPESVLAALDSAPVVPELINVDLMMPGMSGFTLVKKIRARQRCANVPVVIASARAEVRDAVLAGKLGVAFITKPFRIREYVSTVERLIEFSKPFPVPPRR